MLPATSIYPSVLGLMNAHAHFQRFSVPPATPHTQWRRLGRSGTRWTRVPRMNYLFATVQCCGMATPLPGELLTKCDSTLNFHSFPGDWQRWPLLYQSAGGLLPHCSHTPKSKTQLHWTERSTGMYSLNNRYTYMYYR